MPAKLMTPAADVECVMGDRRVFNGLNLQITRGRITAIMGPSGTGKTTLLRLITGQVRPGRGQVLVNGEDVPKLRTRALYSEVEAIADFACILANGAVAAWGKPAELRENDSPVVRQFMHGLAEGPVAFHYPAPDYLRQLLQ